MAWDATDRGRMDTLALVSTIMVNGGSHGNMQQATLAMQTVATETCGMDDPGVGAGVIYTHLAIAQKVPGNSAEQHGEAAVEVEGLGEECEGGNHDLGDQNGNTQNKWAEYG